jgi:L,D-transpeptidase ErfK/SrfK
MRAQTVSSSLGHHLNHIGTGFSKGALLALSLFVMTPSAHAAEIGTSNNGATIGESRVIKTKYEDTLPAIAEREQVGYAELLAANPNVDPLMPGDGTKLLLPTKKLLPNTAHEGIILNVGELRLYYFPKDGSAPRSFPIGIGREGLNTPMGSTTIVRKAANPTWRPTPRMLLENPELEAEMKGGDDENPLGKFALYLGWPSYLLHGTSKPKAVGRRASSGCIRMYANDIQWLFNNVPVGTKVTSVNQPVKMAWIDGALFIEATPSDIQIDELEYKSRQKTISVDDGTIQKIIAFAGDKADQIDWRKTRRILIDRTGVPTQITRGKEVPVTANTLDDVKQAEGGQSIPAAATINQLAAPAAPAVPATATQTAAAQ